MYKIEGSMPKAFKCHFDHFENFINEGFCSLKVQKPSQGT
jgi:hypothetical protein